MTMTMTMILKEKASAYTEEVEKIFKNLPKRELIESEQLKIVHIYETKQRDKKFYSFMSALAVSYGEVSLADLTTFQSFIKDVEQTLKLQLED